MIYKLFHSWRQLSASPLRWAEGAVGTRLRFTFICLFPAVLGIATVCMVRNLASFVELRLEAHSVFRDSEVVFREMEKWTFAVICFNVVAMILWSALSWYAVRKILREAQRLEQNQRQSERF